MIGRHVGLLIVGPGLWLGAAPRAATEDVTRLRAAVEAARRKHHVPGLSVAVV